MSETAVLEPVKSTHKVEVVPLVLEKHPNADRLAVAKVWGFTCVTALADWDGKTLAAYVPPDSIVDTSRPEFSFLAPKAKEDGTYRIRAAKLRGVVSFGLLVPAPAGYQLGDNVADLLGVTHYEPPLPGEKPQGGLITGGECAPAPHVYCVKYDVESGRRYASEMFVPGEPVVVTEKIHGCNSRYVFWNGQMHCGSRNEWKKEYPSYDHITVEYLTSRGKTESEALEIIYKLSGGIRQKNLWWQALERTPSLRAFCDANPGVIVYGEVYGAVQDLNYGHQKGEVSFAAFDVMKDGLWVDGVETRYLLMAEDVPQVPLISTALPFDFDKICELAEGQSLVPGANHLREGVVVKPAKERTHPRFGRSCLKWVSASYLERSK